MAMLEALLGFIRSVFSTQPILANLHRRLREYERFNENRRGFRRPRELRDAVEEDALHYFCKIFMQALELQRVTKECETTSQYDMFLRTTIYIFTIFKKCMICFLPTISLMNSLYVSAWRKNRWMKIFLEYFFFTDEAYFTRAGTFNPHNFPDGQQDNPHVVHRFNYQHRISVNVWAGIVGNYFIGPYLMPSPLSVEIYETFLRVVLPGMFKDVPLGIGSRMWFQHDGARAHFHQNDRQFLNNAFKIGG